MGTLEVDKSLKAAFKETLEPHGFKKVKGRYPHFVRMATPEIIQVINYRLEQALSPQLEEKRFEVYCAVGSIYRPEINLNRSVYASMDWINTTQLDMYFTAKRNGIPVYENEQPGVDYIIKKGDEASLREQIAFAMTGIEHYIIPAFDKVVDLKTCVDYLELYDRGELFVWFENGDKFILPAKYPDKESYSKKIQKDCETMKKEVEQDILDGRITEANGREKIIQCTRSYNDDIEQYGKFFEDEATKNEIARLKAERAEKNINAIRAMGIEV
ncbi:hypothetical protein [Coprococcus eutactus]|uniref:hypothetical protein n=1 Tax=Coprococcus eutactus TaxID=33043 RepID=UPI00015E8A5C|nr:hypothetical protein [Coprococcus eutactus]EDP26377.1 hypothetical protein COPEUT_01573 [Coprococcus eutactus ATCC 27759]UEA80338.1 hypothetical protein LK421_03025 [Coprococcus eutactus ATCC 27759]UWP17783.1 hypothetical protein NQ536_03815 [Coprococcus eutactus]